MRVWPLFTSTAHAYVDANQRIRPGKLRQHNKTSAIWAGSARSLKTTKKSIHPGLWLCLHCVVD